MKLGIIGAMDSEVAALIAAMDNAEVATVAGNRFYDGTIAGRPVVVVQCGIGKVCAALCAQVLVDRFQVDGIVNTGVAGGLAAGMAVGDLVVATNAVQHDFDLSPVGRAKGYVPAFGGEGASYFPADEDLSAAFRRAAQAVKAESGEAFTCHSGTVASGDVFVADSGLKSWLVAEFHAVAAEMEGAAVAQAAYLNGVPFAIVRAISDLADGSASVSFDTFEREAADRSARILLAMLKEG